MSNNKLSSEGIYSEAVSDIIGQIPGGIVRWGMTIFFVIILLVLLASWIVKYPTVIKADFTLYATEIPKPVVAHVNGRVSELTVSEGSFVHKEQVVGIIKNTANYKDILQLSNQLNEFRKAAEQEKWEEIYISPGEFRNIGELESAFRTFYSDYLQVHTLIGMGVYSRRKKMIQMDIVYNDSLRGVLQEQKQVYQNDYGLSDSIYIMKSKLFQEKVIAKQELQEENSRLLTKKLSLNSMDVSIINNKSSFIAKQKELLELDEKYYEAISSFTQSLNKLLSEIEQWKLKYVLFSPEEGKVTFSKVIQENLEIASGDVLFHVESVKSGYNGRLLVSQNNLGKIAIGQQVVIRLAGFPFQEYGFLNGKVASISHIPDEDKKFTVWVDLPDGLVTSNRAVIQFRNELVADAEIITERSRLIYKFIHNLQGIFHPQSGNSDVQ